MFIVCYNGVAVVRGGLHQEFGYIIDRDVVNTTLHWAQQVMVKIGDEDSLMDHKVIYLSGLWLSILKHRRNCSKVT